MTLGNIISPQTQYFIDTKYVSLLSRIWPAVAQSAKFVRSQTPSLDSYVWGTTLTQALFEQTPDYAQIHIVGEEGQLTQLQEQFAKLHMFGPYLLHDCNSFFRSNSNNSFFLNGINSASFEANGIITFLTLGTRSALDAYVATPYHSADKTCFLKQ